MLSKKQILSLVGILVVVVSLPVGVFIVRRQVLRQGRAAESGDLVFETDFENTTLNGDNRLNMGIGNWFEFMPNSPATRMWLERNNTHSGNQSVGQEWLDSRSRRNEFNIFPSSLVGDEWSMSMWLYQPDWSLHTPYSWSWWEFVVMMSEQTNPGSCRGALMLNHDTTKDEYNYFIEWADCPTCGRSIKRISGKPPEGEWFNLHYYYKRHATNGVIKVWINGELTLEVSGVPTQCRQGDSWKTTLAKLYYEASEPQAHQFFTDDLKIWKGYVEPSGSVPPPTQQPQTPPPTQPPTQLPTQAPTATVVATPTLPPTSTATALPTSTNTPLPTDSPDPSPNSSPATFNKTDINQDGKVNILDYVLLFEDFGSDSPQNPRVDINNDGKVNILDYVLLFEDFGS